MTLSTQPGALPPDAGRSLAPSTSPFAALPDVEAITASLAVSAAGDDPSAPAVLAAQRLGGTASSGPTAPADTASRPRKRRGRRPAGQDTRATILASARVLFAEQGYDRVSLRSIARHADVDPALVHHYFKGKPQLFLQSCAAVPPASLPMNLLGGQAGATTARQLVLHFLQVWDEPDCAEAFPTLLLMAAAGQDAGVPFREFLQREVVARIPVHDGEQGHATLRAQLVVSSLLGLAMARYVVRLPDVVAATPEELADQLAPTIDRHLGSGPA